MSSLADASETESLISADSYHPERKPQARAEGYQAVSTDGVAMRKRGSRLIYRTVKRAFDVTFSLAVVVVAFVPSIILCALIAHDTHGSPVYSQERVGAGGRLFRILKFRTMVADSDDVERHLNAEQLEQWQRERKVDGDPRITPLGRKLRVTSLDELPQFLNVLKGDMSVIGPRAITREELACFEGDADELLSIPCGITGWWQVSARNDAGFDTGKRQRLELEYVRGAGLRMDARVFVRTFGAMFGKKSGR